MDNKEIKIRKLLGNRFHLCVSYNENLEISEWHLYRNYYDTKVYFSPDNTEIMNNKTNTIDELYEFAKKHNKVDSNAKTRWVICVMIWLNCILSIVNIFLNNKTITTIVLVNDFDLLFIYYILYRLWNKNWKVDMLELHEYFERSKKEHEELIKELDDNV